MPDQKYEDEKPKRSNSGNGNKQFRMITTNTKKWWIIRHSGTSGIPNHTRFIVTDIKDFSDRYKKCVNHLIINNDLLFPSTVKQFQWSSLCGKFSPRQNLFWVFSGFSPCLLCVCSVSLRFKYRGNTEEIQRKPISNPTERHRRSYLYDELVGKLMIEVRLAFFNCLNLDFLD